MEPQSKVITIQLEIPIAADIKNVWRCLISDVNLWWRKDFYTSPKTKQFIIEPKVGGRMYEDYGNDEGLLWASVLVLESPRLLELKGHLTPQFGGPANTFLRLELRSDGAGTLLTLTDTVFGHVSESSRQDITAGWKMLFEEGFKGYVEGLK